MFAGLHLHLSNRLENLAAELTEAVRIPEGNAFTPEIIVVQSAGMSRWLSQELAARLGICANVRFPFPQRFFNDMLGATFPDVIHTAAFAQEPMAWRIMRLLPSLINHGAFEEVRTYLSGDQRERKLYQLASRIASVFDRYLAYRPAMILEWDSGGEPHDWQAILWRSITGETGTAHQPAMGAHLVNLLRQGATPGLPARVSVFGISTLPPFYIELLGAIAERVEVHLFLMQPTRYLWTHKISARTEAHLRRKGRTREDIKASHYERGNALLASMGDLGKSFFEAVADLNPATVSEPFELPAESTTLSILQSDIFEIEEPEPMDRPAECRSLSVASCHSPMREVEVLYDELLARFESDPSLRPRDVLVMVPDIEVYAPFIDAVFSAPEDERSSIPFSVADRRPRAASGALDTFLKILELPGSRLTTTEVFDILASPCVIGRFDLEESDLPLIRKWLVETRVRWGIDTNHRSEFGLPPFSQNSWRSGLDRLLLGYALPGSGEKTFAGILPFDDIEGSGAQVLGSFVEFTERLFQTVSELRTPRTLESWQITLRSLVEFFFGTDDDTQRQISILRRSLEDLAGLRQSSGFDQAVSLEIIREHLNAVLSEDAACGGYLNGRVTFCALKPMRSIPFRIICLLGMNGTDFPRSHSSPEFDRMAHNPRPQDRTERKDDRYLFLETMLSARDALYISYVGQSVRDNTLIPPSVLVSELLDYCERRFEKGLPIVSHALQAFDPGYFGNGPRFSYSVDNGLAAAAAAGKRVAPASFVRGPLAEPSEHRRKAELSQLVSFFRNPSRFFVRERLKIRLPEDEPPFEDREPFTVGGLEQYTMKEELLSRLIMGADPADSLALFRARGVLPAAAAGEAAFNKCFRAARVIAGKIAFHASGNPLDPESIELDLGEWRVHGKISNLTTTGLVHFRPARFSGNSLLSFWISLLTVNCVRATRGIFITEDRIFSCEPIRECRERMSELLELYSRGLCQPLPLFPRSSPKFVETKSAGDEKKALSKARKEWDGDDRVRGDSVDPFIDLVFHNHPDPLNDEWASVSRAVYEPIFAACREETG
jgi:exodeoxyribonuclease V gamma subunit